MISDNREGLAQILIDEAGDALEWGKYIRFDYPVMNCYGIDECFNLLFTGNKDGVSISDYKNGYVLNAIIDLVRNGQYRIIESWRISQDARMFDATSIQEIYTGDELMNRDEDRVLYNLFFKLFRKPDIFYLIIKYCWFNFVDGLIHAPIMIYEDKVMIYINGGIKDCEAIENWFDTDKE